MKEGVCMFGNKTSKIENAIAKGKASTLVDLAHDKDESIRIAAIDGLGKIKSNDGVNTLVNLLHDPSAEIRKHSAAALGEIGDPHSKAHISFACDKEQDPAAKEAMRHALTKLKDY